MDITFCVLLFGAIDFITSIPATVASGDDTELERLASMIHGNIGRSDNIHKRHSLSWDDLSEVEALLNRFLETRIAKVGKRSGWIEDDPIVRGTDSTPTTTARPSTAPEYLTSSTPATTTTTTTAEINVPNVPSIPNIPSWPSWLPRPKGPWGKRRRRRFSSSRNDME